MYAIIYVLTIYDFSFIIKKERIPTLDVGMLTTLCSLRSENPCVYVFISVAKIVNNS